MWLMQLVASVIGARVFVGILCLLIAIGAALCILVIRLIARRKESLKRTVNPSGSVKIHSAEKSSDGSENLPKQ